jgi:hypothetical protein
MHLKTLQFVFIRTLLLAITCCTLSATDSNIERAFARLYNFDFAGTHRALDSHLVEIPGDPLAYGVRAAALLFQELDRLEVLQGEFFADDKRVAEKKRLKPDGAIRLRFFQTIAEAQTRSRTILAKNPRDENALFTMSLVAGLTADYNSLIDKRQMASFSFIKESNEWAQQLMKVNPAFVDCYLTTGLTEYLVGSLPFFLRWFVHIDGVEGSKDQARVKLQRVAESGRYLKPFAQILLAIYYLREKNPTASQRILAELSRQYPDNPLYRRELGKITESLKPPA